MPAKIGGTGTGQGQKLKEQALMESRTPTFQTTKSIAHNRTNSNQIFSVTESTSATGQSSAIPSLIRVQNTGNVPLFAMFGYKSYSGETAIADSGVTRHLHIMLMPGDSYYPAIRSVIMTATDANVILFDGTNVDNTAPDSNMYTNSGTSINAGEGGTHVIGSATGTNLWLPEGGWTSATNGVHRLFRVGDLIRVNNEIMEVTEVGSGADGTNNNYLTVIRGVHGSTAVDTHSADDAIRFPFFNTYHDFDKYSVAQTDSNGRFAAKNFIGLARAATDPQGIVPGSVAIKFYQPGYQELGLTGITSSQTTSLTASGSYWFKIAIDGGTAESINFTVDSSNTNWGGTNGVISKIQTALDDKYNNSASNTFNQKSTVGIVGGDLRFTSGQHLSTSAIALTAGTDGASAAYNIFAQQNGWFPALANIDAAVVAKLPDDVSYDRVTYASSPTNVFCYDDGYSNLKGMGSGTVNYETGALNMTGCPINAEFVYNVAHTSAFSGKLSTASTTKGGGLVDICVNTPTSKANGSVELKVW